MTQLVINIEDKAILPHLKKILNALEGVSIANTRKERKCELDKALDDVEAGRVTMYASPEALFNDFGI
jgi:hypothetical protein